RPPPDAQDHLPGARRPAVAPRPAAARLLRRKPGFCTGDRRRVRVQGGAWRSGADRGLGTVRVEATGDAGCVASLGKTTRIRVPWPAEGWARSTLALCR